MTENAATNTDYRVNVDVFEGPLDLLLYLIRKNDLDVYDIPIAFVLEEYMKYLDTLKMLDIDLAGEFLLMAAELAHIKSKLLLPDDEAEGSEEDEQGDPRSDLVRRLLEYRQYREAATLLVGRVQLNREVFVAQHVENISNDREGPLEAEIYELVEAFGQILRRIPADQYHAVSVDRVSVNQRIYQLMERIKKDETLTLDEFLDPPFSIHDVVVTFLALLEMSRLRIVKLYQNEHGGTLYLRGSMEEVREEEMMQLVKEEDLSF